MRTDTVLIVDDHALFRSGLRYQVQEVTGGADIIECGSFDEALVTLKTMAHLDLVFADLSLPGMAWDEGIQEIQKRFQKVRVVILSAHEDLDHIQRAMALGAQGYIPKAAMADEFLSALRLILDGGTYVPPVVLTALNRASSIDASSGEALAEPATSADTDLTPRQEDVLRLLSNGLSNKEIGRVLKLAPGTVKQHLSGIFRALKARNRTEAVLKGQAYLQHRH